MLLHERSRIDTPPQREPEPFFGKKKKKKKRRRAKKSDKR
jgi:hypothetical protein